jgi:hypothetical protein
MLTAVITCCSFDKLTFSIKLLHKLHDFGPRVKKGVLTVTNLRLN